MGEKSEEQKAKESKERRRMTWLYLAIFIFYVITALRGGGEFILSKTISNESDIQVNLTKGVIYKIWIENLNGPKKINVKINRGSSIVFEDTFTLTKSKKEYLPSHPKFMAQENGTYHVHAKPLDSGTVNLTIEKL